MKMADLVGTDYRLLTVIYRLGMKLGFGEKTVEETCRESGVNCDTFLLIANVYATDGYVPTLELMTAASAIDLVRYLHASHSYYLEHEFKDLDVLFKDLLGPCTPMQREVIMHFFDGYREEVENPFCIRRGYGVPLCEIRGRRAEGGRIQYRDIRREHNSIDEKLNDLRNIVMKYLPPVCDTVLAIRALSRLCALESDLEKHTLIENAVLIPMVNRMEEKCQ